MMKSILLSLVFYVPTVLYAQNKATDSITFSLDEVFITTKSNLKNINTARSIESIDLNKSRNNGANTLHNILNTTSGVYMVDMGNEQHAMSVRLPINYSPLYNYLENGIPIRPVGIFNNNALLELNRFSLNKIEVVKGTFSGSYGAQSIGASVNFIQNNYNNAINEVAFQSNGYGQIEALTQLKFKSGKTKYLINLNHVQRKIDELFHFNYSKQSASFRSEYEIDNKNQLNFQYNLINYIGDQRDGYNKVDFEAGNLNSYDRFSDRKTLAIRATLEWKHIINNTDNFNITLFHRNLVEEQNPFYLISYVAPFTGRITKDKFTSYGLSANYNKISKNGKLKLNTALYVDATPNNTYKANFIYVNKVNGVNESFISTDSFLTNYKANLLNAALSSSLTFMPNKNWVFNVGVRADLLKYDFTNYLAVSPNAGAASGTNNLNGLNPEVSALYKISNNQSLYVQYSSGFTPPTLSNLYRDATKTPSLTSAKYYNTEMGYKFFTKHFNMQLSLYNMDGVDEFISVITPLGVEVVNAGKTNHYGAELKLNYTRKAFEFNYNSSYSRHFFKRYQTIDWGGNVKLFDNNQMNGAPAFIHYANVSYNFEKLNNLKVNFEWSKVGPYKIDAANEFEYEGYDLFNLKTTFNINKFFINVGLNNLFNTIYATNADGNYGVRYYPGLPRTLQAGVSYRF